jgi:hypothetical protein
VATVYKVLGQAASSVSALSITNKELTSNVATLTLSASHSIGVGQQVSVVLDTADSAFDGVWTVTAVTSTTLSFASNASNVASAAATGTLNAFEHSTLYTCPASTAAVVSTLTICNRSNTAAYYTIALTDSNSGEPAASKYIVKNDVISGFETVALTIGMTLDATNKYLRVSASNANLTFAVFGSEIS